MEVEEGARISQHPVPAILIRQFVPPRTLTSANICIRKSCANICLVGGNIYLRGNFLGRRIWWPCIQPITGARKHKHVRVDQLVPTSWKSFYETSDGLVRERGDFANEKRHKRNWRNRVRSERKLEKRIINYSFRTVEPSFTRSGPFQVLGFSFYRCRA